MSLLHVYIHVQSNYLINVLHMCSCPTYNCFAILDEVLFFNQYGWIMWIAFQAVITV